MIGAVAGFLVGLILLMLVSGDISINSIVNFTSDNSSSLSVQARVLILTVCTILGLVLGFSSGLLCSKRPG